ncbi:MAG: hypothetical protein ACKOD2_14815 [Ilumatobacteraceae bacterium]
MKRAIGTLIAAVAVFGLAACGGDDGGGGNARSLISKSLIESIESDGVTVDSGCVESVVNKLSDEDIAILADNIDEVNSDEVDIDTLGLSDEFFITLMEVESCVSE